MNESILTGRSLFIVDFDNLTDLRFDFTYVTAETTSDPTQSSTQQPGSLVTGSDVTEASTQGGQPSGKKRKGQSDWIPGNSDGFVWKWVVTPRREG
jgi:hypothetical protein